MLTNIWVPVFVFVEDELRLQWITRSICQKQDILISKLCLKTAQRITRNFKKCNGNLKRFLRNLNNKQGKMINKWICIWMVKMVWMVVPHGTLVWYCSMVLGCLFVCVCVCVCVCVHVWHQESLQHCNN